MGRSGFKYSLQPILPVLCSQASQVLPKMQRRMKFEDFEVDGDGSKGCIEPKKFGDFHGIGGTQKMLGL